ncbi:hypothetical protein [Candidatus Synechococcus spongiarum]|uniref:hypothetical protein n=1 Tax=Candidatus Synechococcus spongiarum TaxID=431041 RepID=UPI003F687256
MTSGRFCCGGPSASPGRCGVPGSLALALGRRATIWGCRTGGCAWGVDWMDRAPSGRPANADDRDRGIPDATTERGGLALGRRGG